MYQTFAYYYDLLMDKTLYPQWLQFTRRHLGLPLEDKKVLDLACGTGDLAVLFAQEKADTYGIDLSEEMLTLAEERALQDDVAVMWLQGDMTKLTDVGVGDFDLITCFDDSLCYLTDLTAVERCFSEVYASLKPGGTFLFDVHSLYQMNEVFPGYMYNEHDEDWAFMWSSYSDDQPNSVLHDLTFFVWRDELEAYEALHEEHHERTYPYLQYQQLLEKVGFSEVAVYGGFNDENLQEETPRWLFQAKRSDRS